MKKKILLLTLLITGCAAVDLVLLYFKVSGLNIGIAVAFQALFIQSMWQGLKEKEGV